MALIANRKSVMTLFSSDNDIHCHRVRIVLAEKGINFEVVDVNPANPPEDLIELNPYGAQVIMEYLDERFPHPPLMPVDPVSRGRTRMTLRRIQRDWDSLVDKIVAGQDIAQAAKELKESLTVVSPIFEQKPFFMSDEFSLMDCAVAPILWRLPAYGIELPPQAKAIRIYAERLFDLDSFQTSLTEVEREIQQ
jgi:RNA polymerase-associated protein